METNTKTLSNIVIEQEKEIKELRMQLNTIIIAQAIEKRIIQSFFNWSACVWTFFLVCFFLP